MWSFNSESGGVRKKITGGTQIFCYMFRGKILDLRVYQSNTVLIWGYAKGANDDSGLQIGDKCWFEGTQVVKGWEILNKVNNTSVFDVDEKYLLTK